MSLCPEFAGDIPLILKLNDSDSPFESAMSMSDADVVLVAVGRRPFSEDLGARELGVAYDERGLAINIGTFPFMANARAKCLGETEGGVKIIADATTDKVLGVHILGPRASDLIAESVLAMEYGASSEDIARTVHAHPTLPEAVREAALDVAKRSLNI